ncbi:MAG: type II secretion system F family protein [Candidatus Woesearchaeota archaeon]
MSLSGQIVHNFPELKEELKKANIGLKPVDYVSKNIKSALFLAVLVALLAFFVFSKNGMSFFVLMLVFIALFFLFFMFFMASVKVKILRKAKKIDKEVLFAGRFLLIKLRSGKPLLNSLIDASRSYGVASDFFKEIVRDIELGTPLEKALEKAVDYCPSEKFRRILFQINNALKIGVDVTNFLEAILEDIADEQLIEIQRYGKKLNGITMFYMLLAVVFPSLGMTMFIILSSMMSINVGIHIYFLIGFFLFVIEFMFISIFRSIRPNVNI